MGLCSDSCACAQTVLVPRSRRDSEARLRTFEARLEQRRHQGLHRTVGLMIGQELRTPLDDARRCPSASLRACRCTVKQASRRSWCSERAASRRQSSRDVRRFSGRRAFRSLVGDRLCDVEQQEIVEEDIRVGGQRFRRPIRLAVEHVPGGEATLEALQERLQLLRDCKRRLLIPQVAKIVDPQHRGIVEPHVRLLFWAADPARLSPMRKCRRCLHPIDLTLRVWCNALEETAAAHPHCWVETVYPSLAGRQRA